MALHEYQYVLSPSRRSITRARGRMSISEPEDSQVSSIVGISPLPVDASPLLDELRL